MLVKSVQLRSSEGESKRERLGRAENILTEMAAERRHPTQILFPEIWGTGFFSFENYKNEAEKEEGDTFDLMSGFARQLSAYIHTGSFVEKDGEEYFNTSLLLDPNGKIIGKYRKIHLFPHNSREADILTSGGLVSVIKTEYGRVGLSTCYDLRFPELFRAMLNLGAEYFLVTSAWPQARLDHWRLFNRVRAVENQCFLLSCNGTGEIANTPLGGNSMIVDPWGTVLAAGDESPSVVSADINPEAVWKTRTDFPVLKGKVLI